jgi:hypothetical protein
MALSGVGGAPTNNVLRRVRRWLTIFLFRAAIQRTKKLLKRSPIALKLFNFKANYLTWR